MLIVLLPLVYGVRTLPPLRIFGVPPPVWMLSVTGGAPTSGSGPDNARANVVEALLGDLRLLQDEGYDEAGEVADALQDLWWKLKIGVEANGWQSGQPWTFARKLLSVQFNSLPSTG